MARSALEGVRETPRPSAGWRGRDGRSRPQYRPGPPRISPAAKRMTPPRACRQVGAGQLRREPGRQRDPPQRFCDRWRRRGRLRAPAGPAQSRAVRSASASAEVPGALPKLPARRQQAGVVGCRSARPSVNKAMAAAISPASPSAVASPLGAGRSRCPAAGTAARRRTRRGPASTSRSAARAMAKLREKRKSRSSARKRPPRGSPRRPPRGNCRKARGPAAGPHPPPAPSGLAQRRDRGLRTARPRQDPAQIDEENGVLRFPPGRFREGALTACRPLAQRRMRRADGYARAQRPSAPPRASAIRLFQGLCAGSPFAMRSRMGFGLRRDAKDNSPALAASRSSLPAGRTHGAPRAEPARSRLRRAWPSARPGAMSRPRPDHPCPQGFGPFETGLPPAPERHEGCGHGWPMPPRHRRPFWRSSACW